VKRNDALKLVLDELDRATDSHPAMDNPHYGYAVILEEVDELWDEIKANNGTTHRATSEAVQIAAMGLRYLIDLCDDTAVKQHQAKVREFDYDMRGRSSGGAGYSG
jgi:hypothetical protein